MTRKIDFEKVPFDVCVNMRNVEYRVFNFLNLEILMFPSNMFFAENLNLKDFTKGDLVYSEYPEGIKDSAGEHYVNYIKLGVWSKFDDFFELKIKGYGIFNIVFGSNQAHIYEMEPDNQLEELAIEALKRVQQNYQNPILTMQLD